MFKTREYHRRPPADLDGLAVFRRAKFSPEGPYGGGTSANVSDLIKTAMTEVKHPTRRLNAIRDLINLVGGTPEDRSGRTELLKGLFEKLFRDSKSPSSCEVFFPDAIEVLGREKAFLALQVALGDKNALKIAIKTGFAGVALETLFKTIGEKETYALFGRKKDEARKTARVALGDVRAFVWLSRATSRGNAAHSMDEVFNAFLGDDVLAATWGLPLEEGRLARITQDAQEKLIAMLRQVSETVKASALPGQPSLPKEKPMEPAVLEAKLKAFFGIGK